MIDNRIVGRTIAALRQSRNMTQQQLAAALNVSHQAVSKWENGAALPDVQTLMALAQLFGVTLEQLLTGDVPADRLRREVPGDDPIQNIGAFFNNIVSGIFQPAQPDDDGAAEASFDEKEAAFTFDVEKLLKMAPFMSREALDELLLKYRDRLTEADISRFAPFISKDCLEKLIQNPQTNLSWDTLQRIAPFLKREVVDRLARLAAEGTKAVQDAAANADLGRTLDGVTQTIGKGVEQVVKFGGEMFNEVVNSFTDGSDDREARAKALRNAAARRAMDDGNWTWLADHIEDITDEALRCEIAQKANSQGMHDWVLAHLEGYADTNTVDAAIAANDWDWLGDNVWQFADDIQQKIALAAVAAGKWDWLSTYSAQMKLGDRAGEIAIAAYHAGESGLAGDLVEHIKTPDQREALADEAAAQNDYDFLDEIADELRPEYFGRLCLARAQDSGSSAPERWDAVARFADRADRAAVMQLMELAIAEGNFDAIDTLNPLL